MMWLNILKGAQSSIVSPADCPLSMLCLVVLYTIVNGWTRMQLAYYYTVTFGIHHKS
jgi:hypothetical protein